MLMRTIVALAAIFALGSNGSASAHQSPRHHRHRAQRPISGAAGFAGALYGGRLVMHPAENIACDTPYRSTRALPCDQPVWVYGSPCEVDLGLGRYRSCDWR